MVTTDQSQVMKLRNTDITLPGATHLKRNNLSINKFSILIDTVSIFISVPVFDTHSKDRNCMSQLMSVSVKTYDNGLDISIPLTILYFACFLISM